MGSQERACGAKSWLPIALLAGLLACSGGDRPPNLLLVTVDTLRADRLRCYGGAAGERLCGLFDSGTRYRWAFSTAPSTAPSIASVLTSRYPAFHGVTPSVHSALADDAVTVAETLRDAGYTTAAFVSNPVLHRSRRLDQGFSTYDQEMTRREPNRPGFGERDAAATTDAVLSWARRGGREPWFVWVHYQDPHGPYLPPGTPAPRDEPGAPPLPLLTGQSGRGGIPAYQALPGVFTLGAYERAYLDEIRHLDGHVERLVRALDAMGRPPALLLTADHGEAFGEDGYYFAHGHSVALDQIRVPMLLRGTRVARVHVVDEAVSGVDVAPTLLALAGLPIPATYQGRALPGALGDPEPARAPRPVFAERGPRAAAVASGGRFYVLDRGDPRSPSAARLAQLDGRDALPAYVPGEGSADAAPLASLLRDFLAPTRGDRRALSLP